jgi:23S rRNA (cytosine1962-C5)-methyltransferase
MALTKQINQAKQLEQKLLLAKTRRKPLEQSQDTNAYRLVNGFGDALAGLTIDRFADVLVVSLYENIPETQELILLEMIAQIYQPNSIYLKRRPKEARVVANTKRSDLAPETAAWGQNTAQTTVLERGVQYVIRPGGDLSVGIFLDMRDTRTWLSQNIGTRRVLNCFSYTCGFGLIAALSNSTRAVNLDLSRKVLDWGQENYRLNNLEPKDMDFISGDTFEWFKRFTRRNDTFEAIILDPPSFATSNHSRFSAASNYDELISQAVQLLEPNGLLLACCNHAKLSRLQFKKAITKGLSEAKRGYNLLKSLGQSNLDYPVPDTDEAPLKVFALEVI